MRRLQRVEEQGVPGRDQLGGADSTLTARVTEKSIMKKVMNCSRKVRAVFCVCVVCVCVCVYVGGGVNPKEVDIAHPPRLKLLTIVAA